jgi:hypothetical protein
VRRQQISFALVPKLDYCQGRAIFGIWADANEILRARPFYGDREQQFLDRGVKEALVKPQVLDIEIIQLSLRGLLGLSRRRRRGSDRGGVVDGSYDRLSNCSHGEISLRWGGRVDTTLDAIEFVELGESGAAIAAKPTMTAEQDVPAALVRRLDARAPQDEN